MSGDSCNLTPWGCYCPAKELIYTEVKTNDVIPAHSGSAQTFEPNCDSAECCHAQGGLTCYWDGWECNCHTLEEESHELSSTAKKMMMVNFWSGFISELESLNAENMEGCIDYTESAFINLLQYQQSLNNEKHFQAYLEWSKLSIGMPAIVNNCHKPNNPYSHATEWFESFTQEDLLHSIVIDAFSSNRDTLESHQQSQKENWNAGKFFDAGIESAKYWKTMNTY